MKCMRAIAPAVIVLFLCVGCSSDSEHKEEGPLDCESISCAAKHRVCIEATHSSYAACGDCTANAYAVGDSCALLAQCRSDEYERVAPTATSDRSCAELTQCRDNEYEAAAPTETTDRVCVVLTECGKEAYEDVAPTNTSDRVCATGTTCEAGQYESAPLTETADRECTALTECGDGEVESREVQTDGSSFEDRKCCTHELEDLLIDDAWSTPEAACLIVDGNVDIAPLSADALLETRITQIGGSLTINEQPQLTHLEGLHMLEHVGGDVVIKDNANLTNLDGFGALKFIGGKLEIEGNHVLTHISSTESGGFSVLNEVRGDVLIVNNRRLLSPDGLGALEEIGGRLVIIRNQDLMDIPSLTTLRSVGGLLPDPDPDAEQVQATVLIGRNAKLESIAGLSSLDNVRGALHVVNNPNLLTLNGLQELSDVSGLTIKRNKKLQNFEGLNGLMMMMLGTLTIEENDGIESLQGFGNLKVVDSLVIKDNASLTGLDGMELLSVVMDGLHIVNNANLCEDFVDDFKVAIEAYEMIEIIDDFVNSGNTGRCP